MSSSDMGSRRKAEEALFLRLRDPQCSESERVRIRAELVEMHLPLVHHIARRYSERGEPMDDIVQAGSIGLVQAVDRFDPERGVAFSSFAVPTIVGSIRRHFRDATWSVKVPRRVQELRGRIDEAHEQLAQELQRSPTVSEIATRAEVDAQDVLDSLELSHLRRTESLTATTNEESPLAERIGEPDPAISQVEDSETISRLLGALSERERRIVTMRFFEGASQSQIAEQLGISQMHVSRLLSKSMARLRGELVDSDGSTVHP